MNGIKQKTNLKIAKDNNTNNNHEHQEKKNKDTSLDVTIRSSGKKTRKIKRRNNINVKHSAAGEFDAKQVKRYIFIQSRIYLLSSLIGDRQKPYNATKGVIGMILWILNLLIHFSLDFYEANTVFHVSWASSIGVFLVMFLVSTVFLIRHTVRWFIKTLKRLSKDKIYNSTFVKLLLVFKVMIFAIRM